MLKVVLSKDEFGSLDEADKKHYAESKEVGEGFYLLQAASVTLGDNVWSVEDVGSLKRTVSTLRETEKRLKEYEGLDPSKARAALRKVEEFGNIDPKAEASKKFEALREQLEEKHGNELKEKDDLLREKDVLLQEAVITSAATRAISESKASVALLLPTVEKGLFTEIIEIDGRKKAVARVKDSKTGGTRITLKSGSQDPMDVKEYVETFRDLPEYRGAFAGDGKKGVGSESSERGAPQKSGSISVHDQDAVNASLEGIAEGSVTVDLGE